MKKLILLLIITCSTSCAGMPSRFTPYKQGVDPELQTYVDFYKKTIINGTYERRFERLNVNFANLEYPTVGRCSWYFNGEYEIEIDKLYWSRSSFIQKQFVMYHELEHCVRFRGHSDRKQRIENLNDFFDEIGYHLGIVSKPGYLPDGCPASVMHSLVFSRYCREKHYIHYLNEMRNFEK